MSRTPVPPSLIADDAQRSEYTALLKKLGVDIDALEALLAPDGAVREQKDFDETLHPRDENGRFASGGGTTSLPPIQASQQSQVEVQRSVSRMEEMLQANDKSDASANAIKAYVVGGLARSLKDNPDFQHLMTIPNDARLNPPDSYGYADKTEYVCNSLVKQWAQESGDHAALPVAMQLAAQKEFGLDDAFTAHFGLSTLDDAHATYDDVMPGLQAFMRAQYNSTQDFLSREGVDSVTAWRGASWSSSFGEKPPDSLPFDGNTSVASVQEQPASSWTVSPEASIPFASRGEDRAIFTTTVPRERILSTSQTGMGCQGEGEVVVLGGQHDATTYSYTRGQGDNRIEISPKGPNETADRHEALISLATGKLSVPAWQKAREKPVLLDEYQQNADWPKRTNDVAHEIDTRRPANEQDPRTTKAFDLLFKEWDESLHSRDDHGRFASGASDTDADAEADKPSDGTIVTPAGNVVAPSADQAREVDERAHKHFGSLYDAKTAQLTEQAQAFTKDAHVAIAIDSHDLAQVLADGRFKSQFEVPKSGGFYAPGARAEAEHELLGYSENLDPTQRPIYGYLTKQDDGTGGGEVSTYGDARVALNDDVRDSTTFTYGDSLGMSRTSGGSGVDATAYPVPVTAPDWHAVGVLRPSIAWDTAAFNAGGPKGTVYAEAQIHGGVDVSAIKSVTFQYDDFVDQSTKDALDKAGIPYKVRGA